MLARRPGRDHPGPDRLGGRRARSWPGTSASRTPAAPATTRASASCWRSGPRSARPCVSHLQSFTLADMVAQARAAAAVADVAALVVSSAEGSFQRLDNRDLALPPEHADRAGVEGEAGGRRPAAAPPSGRPSTRSRCPWAKHRVSPAGAPGPLDHPVGPAAHRRRPTRRRARRRPTGAPARPLSAGSRRWSCPRSRRSPTRAGRRLRSARSPNPASEQVSTARDKGLVSTRANDDRPGARPSAWACWRPFRLERDVGAAGVPAVRLHAVVSVPDDHESGSRTERRSTAIRRPLVDDGATCRRSGPGTPQLGLPGQCRAARNGAAGEPAL